MFRSFKSCWNACAANWGLCWRSFCQVVQIFWKDCLIEVWWHLPRLVFYHKGTKLPPLKGLSLPRPGCSCILPLVACWWSGPCNNGQKVLLFLLLLLLDKLGSTVISWFWTVGMFCSLVHNFLQTFRVLATNSVVILSCRFPIPQGVLPFCGHGTSWPHLIVIPDL